MAERRVCEHCQAELSPKWGQGFCPFCGKSILPLHMLESGITPKSQVKPKQRKISPPRKNKRTHPSHEQPLGKHEKTARNHWFWRKKEDEKEKQPKASKRDRIANLRTSAESSSAPILLFVSPFWLFIQNLITLGLRGLLWFRFNEASLRALVRKETVFPVGVYRLWCFILCTYIGCVFGLLGEGFISVWDYSAVAGSILVKPAIFCFFFSWLISRYMLFWMRWIILENIFSKLADIKGARSLKPFAPAPLMLWFFGVSYMQAQINSLIWAGVFRPFIRDNTRRRGEKPRQKEERTAK